MYGVLAAVVAVSCAHGAVADATNSLRGTNSTGTLEALASWWCAPVGGVCGGPWKLPRKCCGKAKCQKLLGGDGTMKCVEEHPEPHASSGCWSSNGAICQYVLGESTGCYGTAVACSRATGKPTGCYEYNGAICEWVVGDTASKCHETKGHCEKEHRRLSGARAAQNGTLEAEAILPGHSADSNTGTEEDTTKLNSTGTMESLASWWCARVGDVCGGPWKLPRKCCGKAQCQKLLGGDGTMKCVEEHPEQQCVETNGECGGPGRRTETCCHGACEHQPLAGGSGVMKCVDKQCAAPHAECGGSGRRTLPCCVPEFSCKALLGGDVMKCM